MYRARLVSRLPPRLSRRRLVLPEEAGIGATPHSRANGASLRRRWGLSPAASSSAAAMSVPTPLEGQQPRGRRGDQPLQVPIQLGDLGRQLL